MAIKFLPVMCFEDLECAFKTDLVWYCWFLVSAFHRLFLKGIVLRIPTAEALQMELDQELHVMLREQPREVSSKLCYWGKLKAWRAVKPHWIFSRLFPAHWCYRQYLALPAVFAASMWLLKGYQGNQSLAKVEFAYRLYFH